MNDHEARVEAVTNISDTLLVEAGAGTGKTTLLIDRICALIERGTEAKHIAAVTFTVKAAGELKERLREKLKERHSERAQRALRELDQMTVKTIHGWAAELLRTLPVEAKLPPEFVALDELQSAASIKEFRDNWLTRALNDNTPLCLDLAESIGLSLLGSENKGLANLFDVLSSSQVDIESISCGEQGNRLGDLIEHMQTLISALQECAASCTSPDDELFRVSVDLSKHAARCPELLYSTDGVTWLQNVRLGNKGRGAKPNWSNAEVLATAKEIRNALAELLAETKAALTSQICADIVNWLAPAIKEYREQLRERGTLGFDEQLSLCRDMLRDSQTARDYFKKLYNYIHIDEFQDTDPIQVEILFYLCERIGNFTRAWHEIELEPGKLFVVGDPKQSIYRFRGADVRIYKNVAQRIEKTGQKLSITKNFRSSETILSEVNAVFTPVMTGKSENEAQYEPLLPSDQARHDPAAVELLLPPEDYDRVSYNTKQSAAQEADAIAEHVKTIAGDGKQFRYSDIAILLKADTNSPALTNALSARDIPFISFLNSAFTARVEIEAALTMLHALANPQHTVAVIGALRSPWFALSDDDLVAHKFSGRTFVYTEAQPEDTLVGKALQELQAWHNRSRMLRASDLLELLYEEFPIDVMFGTKADGVQRVHNLHTLVEHIRRLESGGVGSLSEITTRLSDMTRLVQSTELEARDDTRNAVQLITLHKAKGLEFPVVYLYAFREKTKGESGWQLLKSLGSEPHQLALKINDAFSTANFKNVDEATKAAQSSELQRLLYVGMTRAKDKLILPLGWLRTSKKNQTALSPSALAARYRLDEHNKVDLNAVDAVQTTSAPRAETEFKPYSAQLQVKNAGSEDSIAAFKEWQTKFQSRAESLNPSVKREPEEDDTAVEWSRVRARQIGTYIHSVLEQLIKGKSLNTAEQIAGRGATLTQDGLDEARDILTNVIQSPLFKTELPTAKRIVTELPIVAAENASVVAQFVDLMFETPDGKWILLDYKTDDIPPEAVESRKEDHRKQLERYAGMFAKIMGEPPAETRLYFLRPNKMVKL